MKQTLLLFLLLTLSISALAQVPGPPPPCGITPGYVCDYDGDGFAVFNLTEVFTFYSLCLPIGEDEADYSDIVYYETEEDMDNETNPILNNTSYINKTNPQNIYYRVNAINGNAGFEFIKSMDNFIEVLEQPALNSQNSLTLCNVNSNGSNTFDLSDSEESILAGLNPSLYLISYHETFNDAELGINQLTKNAYNNIINPQVIYARVSHFNYFQCYNIVALDLQVQNICEDIAVYFISETSPRPGFTSHNYVKVKNIGSSTNISGSVEFKKDPLMNIDNIYYVSQGNSINNTSTGFILNFNNLEPNKLAMVSFKLGLPTNVSLGTIITNSASYNVNDINLENNISTLVQTVIGSYDPNDIAESHGPEIFYDDFTSNDYLYYTIRFQNVGTADAINVSIDNTLGPKLDKSSIQMLASSHNHVFTRTDNQLNWKFNNIHLPSESMDEPNSHGYVYYKIKPTAGFQVGDIIPNTAEIYFDFNPAVVTNTFETEFVATLSNEKFDEVNYVMFLNPTNNFVEIKFSKSTSNKIQLGVYDIQGKLILEDKRELQNNATMLDISNLRSGMYFLKINDGTGQMTQKLIVN